MRLKGKTALITGGARGMGAAHVRRFIDEGAAVWFTDILQDEGLALAASCGPRARFSVADVTNESDWRRVVSEAEAAFGPISVLVNNAGYSARNRIEDTSESEYRRIVDVNQLSVFLGTKAIIPSMRGAGGGSIVNISSISGMVGRIKSMAYTASKFAVRGMTKVTATELGPENIRANSVHPGPIETSMLSVLNDQEKAQLVARVPLQRSGRVEEVSDLVVFLASDESSFITGSEFVIDGGVIAG